MGDVECKRASYELPGGGRYRPFDNQTGIEFTGRISILLKDSLARLSTLLPYRQAVREIEHLLCISISHMTAKKCTEEVGEIALQLDPKPIQFKKSEMISMQVDGGMIRTINDWREVKVGIVASDDKKIQMSMIGDHNEFMDKYCNFIRENGYHTHLAGRNLVSDGARWIGDDFFQRFPKMPQVLDYYHFKEHLHATAEAIYPDNKVEADFWVERIKELAFKNKSEAIIDVLTLEWQFQNSEGNRTASESVRKLIQYLWDNRDKIRYGKFKELGYEIGSGKVEATIKTLLNGRMKSASIRWHLRNAEKLLTLRNFYFNNQWNMLSSNL